MKQNSILTRSNPSLVNRNFSHIYIEEGAKDFPESHRVLKKFPNATTILIDDYRSVFNRHNQRFQAQKTSIKLVLAVKKQPFIYSGSPYAPNFGAVNFYYNAVILNCIYNCDYCYLQGMYSSSNIVIFVNHVHFFEAANKILLEKGSIYLCISYDTDLLAFESIFPNCRQWIEWAEAHSSTVIEIRTKSANFKAIADLPPPKNTILAWTLSPQSIVAIHEKKTPPLKSRLSSINEALNAGWKVRICFDPLLRVNNWKAIYQEMLKKVFSTIQADKVFDFSLGVFRMNSEYLERIRKEQKGSPILYHPFTRQNQLYTYSSPETLEIVSFVKDCIKTYYPNARIFI